LRKPVNYQFHHSTTASHLTFKNPRETETKGEGRKEGRITFVTALEPLFFLLSSHSLSSSHQQHYSARGGGGSVTPSIIHTFYQKGGISVKKQARKQASGYKYLTANSSAVRVEYLLYCATNQADHRR